MSFWATWKSWGYAKRQKECTFSTTEVHFPGRGMGLNIDAGAPVTGTYRVHPVGCEKNKARPVTHCQTVSETVRSYDSSIQCDTFWTSRIPGRSKGLPCAFPLRQHIGGFLHKSPGGFAVTSTLQTGVPNPPVVPREVVVSSSSLHPRGPQYRSRHPVETGTEARGMEAPPRGGGDDMEAWVDLWSGVSLSTLNLAHAFQLLLRTDWTWWCRRGRGFVCVHFPWSLYSRES